jgi:hypothetical protein
MEIRAQAERDSGIGLKLFGFIAESVFTFIPELCSGSSRNAVRNHPGIAFTFPRIPHTGEAGLVTGIGWRWAERRISSHRFSNFSLFTLALRRWARFHPETALRA